MIEKYFRNGLVFRWTAPGPVILGCLQDGTFVNTLTPTPPLVYLGVGKTGDPKLMLGCPPPTTSRAS
jgi:hypothetical protein